MLQISLGLALVVLLFVISCLDQAEEPMGVVR